MSKIVILVWVLVLLTVPPAFACDPPPVECPEVYVTCDCSSGVILPGLYAITVKGEYKCGTVTILPSGFLINDEFFKLGRWRKVKPVEVCP